jgi:hypothetical protein
MIHVGLDPGWESFGYAVRLDSTLLIAGNLVPSSYADLRYFIEDGLKANLSLPDSEVGTTVTMERFVTYQDKFSQVSENVLMVIGAVVLSFQQANIPVDLVRAIDWKIRVMKYLVRTKGLNNPFTSFDKKFSVWAAKQLMGETTVLKSTHEADAICLSFLPDIEKYNARKHPE